MHQYYITAWYSRAARIVILSHFFIFDYIFINNVLVAPLNHIADMHIRTARNNTQTTFFVFDYIFINNDLVAPLNHIADMHIRTARNNTQTTHTGPYSYTLFTKHLQYITANQTKTHAQLVSSQMVQSQTYSKKFSSVAFNLLPLYGGGGARGGGGAGGRRGPGGAGRGGGRAGP